MQLRAAVLIAVVACPAAGALADTSVWLVGGGNTLDNSQGQIEANVRWLEGLLLADEHEVYTYFGIGQQPGVDVVYRSAEPGGADTLARVLGDSSGTVLLHKRHELSAVRGSTAKHELTEGLRSDFARLPPGDDLLLVYNGHGGVDRADTRNNYLKLWGDERMTVAELEALLDATPPASTVRFVMTQCYSGAFHGLIYDRPDRAAGYQSNRCGFMAESALRQAEGCELDANQAEFRDYTTFFFAALTGATRLGEPLPLATVDRDGNGAVSYREAHFHALVAADSTDLPRATSEQFLEDWSPWYLRWDSAKDNPASIYWTLADELAARHRWTAAELDRAHARYAEAAAHGEHGFAAAQARIEDLRLALAADLSARWPELAGTFGSVTPADRADIETSLAADPRYAELTERQGALGALGRDSLEQARLLTQVEKVYRLRHLARLEQALERYGSGPAKRQYRKLLQCEGGTLDCAAP